ncbi:nucleotidyltransferase family protein [Sporomusa malonica]|uniref:Polymerase beta nucleotidyltransferase domain-containing protein n=2 Tax=Sporomusa malonica TaxID=112901 RepID=A0A1W1YTU5_9FIRM|nr:hypothetical protein SAMN04488500_102190 [Sporomusa malonica]
MMDIHPRHEHIVKTILRRHVPDAAVYAFGSRVALTAKPHSDLDLVIVGKEEIPIHCMHLLEEAFADSDLPFRVDVLDWHVIPDDFRKHIIKCREAICTGDGSR